MYKFATPLFALIGAGESVDSLIFASTEDAAATDKQSITKYKTLGEMFVTEVLSEKFSDCFMEHLSAKMRSKLGLVKDKQEDDMQHLIIPLLDWMTEYKVDYHRFFRSLANYCISEAGEEHDEKEALENLLAIVPHDETAKEQCSQALKPWLAMYRYRLLEDGLVDNLGRKERMNAVNPRFVLRNWILQDVIDKFDKTSDEEAADVLNACLEACLEPYKDKYDDDRIETWINSPVPEVTRKQKNGYICIAV